MTACVLQQKPRCAAPLPPDPLIGVRKTAFFRTTLSAKTLKWAVFLTLTFHTLVMCWSVSVHMRSERFNSFCVCGCVCFSQGPPCTRWRGLQTPDGFCTHQVGSWSWSRCSPAPKSYRYSQHSHRARWLTHAHTGTQHFKLRHFADIVTIQRWLKKEHSCLSQEKKKRKERLVVIFSWQLSTAHHV